MSNSNPIVPYVDLSGLFEIQKNYLNNLKSSSSNPESVDKINDVQKQLQNLYSSFSTAKTSTDSILDHQNEMLDIVNKENNRLALKKQSVDTALDGKKRAIKLNESNRLRYEQYTKIIIVIIITLALFIGISITSKFLPFLPQFIFDILSIFVITIGLFTSYFIFLNMQMRSNMNFDELDLPGPKILSEEEIQKGKAQEAKYGNLLGSIDLVGCMGSDCCDVGTLWDTGNSVCRPIVPFQNPFTTISVAYKQGDINGPVKSNSPNEFESYSKI
jgi:hypothetical protein